MIEGAASRLHCSSTAAGPRALLGVEAGRGFSQFVGSSRVRARETDLIAGAANRTIGMVIAQEKSRDANQLLKKFPVAKTAKLAIRQQSTMSTRTE